MIRIWDGGTGQVVHTLQSLAEGESSGDTSQAYTGLMHCTRLEALAAVTYDHNIILYSLKEFKAIKQV